MNALALAAARQQGTKSWLASVYEDDDLLSTSASSYVDNQRLALAACLCEEMRSAVLERTGFKCSAGIAHNKVCVDYVQQFFFLIAGQLSEGCTYSRVRHNG